MCGSTYIKASSELERRPQGQNLSIQFSAREGDVCSLAQRSVCPPVNGTQGIDGKKEMENEAELAAVGTRCSRRHSENSRGWETRRKYNSLDRKLHLRAKCWVGRHVASAFKNGCPNSWWLPSLSRTQVPEKI